MAFDCDALRKRNALSPLDEGLKMVLPTFEPLSPRSATIPLVRLTPCQTHNTLHPKL